MSKEYNLTFNFRIYWIISWVVLIFGSLIALVDVSKRSCGEYIPILLSRALTSDPYRGGTLILCLFASISSIYLNSILLTVGFFGFLCAFLVSMFDTAPSHDALIIAGSMLVMWECWPDNTLLWQVHWWFTVVCGLVCIGWFLYIIFGCKAESWPEETLPLPDSVECERCSWWFISEYLAFWSMFMLVYWKIDPKLEWRDHFCNKKEKAVAGEMNDLLPKTKKNKLLFYKKNKLLF